VGSHERPRSPRSRLCRDVVMSVFSLVPTPVVAAIKRMTGFRRVKDYEKFVPYVSGKIGLEIGGPSPQFCDRGAVPLYRHVLRMDNAVYSNNTPFTFCDSSGSEFNYHPAKPLGRNMFLEATDLRDIETNAYDFLFSSHCLEHVANPIKALKEWQRIVKPDGALIIALPHHRYTFDRRRPLTSVSHMVDDYMHNIGEDDQTHIQEVLDLHDFSLHVPRPSYEELRHWVTNNLSNRGVHHHVFDEINSRALLEAAGLKVLSLGFVRPIHIIMLATGVNT
jgi:SAM-dependent methyltransferase